MVTTPSSTLMEMTFDSQSFASGLSANSVETGTRCNRFLTRTIDLLSFPIFLDAELRDDDAR